MKLLTASDIAAERGWHRVTAWRWLKALRAKYGSEIVWEKDRKLVTSHEALERVAKEMPAPPDERILRRVKLLEIEVRETTQRVDGLSRELTEFRQKSRDWLSRGR